MQKILRSLIHEKFPEELRLEIVKLSKRRDILNDEKQGELFKILRQYDLGDITPLGPGTNRYAFKIDGFVVKFATNKDGIIDNFKEFKMAKRLYPHVTKIYEVAENGTLLVAEYIQPFQSYGEMYQYADQIRGILTKISAVYLIGDVGITAKNYANWGLRIGSDSPVCLDFAYVYNVRSELFLCRKCKNNSMLFPDKDFVKLVCPARGCGAVYEFTDIRRRIGNDVHKHEIGDLSEEGYVMTESNILTELTPERSNYLESTKVEEAVEETEEEITIDNFELEYALDHYLYKEGNKDMNLNTSDMKLPGSFRVKAVAKVVEEEKVAFSGDVSESADVIKAIAVVKKPEPVEENIPVAEEIGEIPNEEATENVVESPAEEDVKEPVEETVDASPFTRKFIDGSHYAVSNIGTLIQETMMKTFFFDSIKNDIIQKKMYPADFYKILTTAVYKAIVGFCQFEQIEIPNGNKPGTHRGFRAPEHIVGTEFEPTMVYLQRMFIDDRINKKQDIDEAMAAYRELYNDYLGVQREVIPLLKSELVKRIQMTESGYHQVINTVDKMIFVPAEVDDIRIMANAMKEAEEEGMNYDLKARLDAEIAADMKKKVDEEVLADIKADEDLDINKILAAAAQEAIKEAEETPGEVLAFSSDIDADDADGEDEDYIQTTVYIYHEDDTDIIKLSTGDAFGNVQIPIYEKLDDIDLNKVIPSLADDRNGMWDWLIHITPLMKFQTEDPDKWLEFNDEEMHESFVHPVILEINQDKSATMGMYIVEGIYDVNEEGEAVMVNDKDMLWKVNAAILNNVSTNSISHYQRNVSIDGPIIPEDEISRYVIMEDDDGNDREIDEFMTETPDSQEDSAEDAAIKALLGGDPMIGVDVTEDELDTVSSDEEVEEKNEDLIFTPIRKPHNN